MVRNHVLQKIGSSAERRIRMVIYAESGVGNVNNLARSISGLMSSSLLFVDIYHLFIKLFTVISFLVSYL